MYGPWRYRSQAFFIFLSFVHPFWMLPAILRLQDLARLSRGLFYFGFDAFYYFVELFQEFDVLFVYVRIMFLPGCFHSVASVFHGIRHSL
jgi:hypothetical protein